MSKNGHNTAQSAIAVFTVCADPDLITGVTDISGYANNLYFAGEFQQYLSHGRRTYFSPQVRESGACMALIDFDKDRLQAATTAEVLRQLFGHRIRLVAVSAQQDADMLLEAMRAGCNEHLLKPVDQTALTNTLSQVREKLEAETARQHTTGRILVFLGAKGGVGTTTLAVHLSSFLVKRHGKKVLVIDHHHQLGHVCLLLGLKDNLYNFEELLRNVDRLDTDLLQGYVVRHMSGLEVLASPDTCSAQHRHSRVEIEQALDFLRGEYDFIVIDSSPQYGELTNAIVDQSDELFLVSTPDVAAIRDLSRYLENLTLNENISGKIKIVVNRSSSNDAVKPEQIEKAVRFPVSIAIPNNYAELMQALNAGEPITPQRRTDFTQQMSKWASSLAEDAAAPVKTEKKKFSLWK